IELGVRVRDFGQEVPRPPVARPDGEGVRDDEQHLFRHDYSSERSVFTRYGSSRSVMNWRDLPVSPQPRDPETGPREPGNRLIAAYPSQAKAGRTRSCVAVKGGSVWVGASSARAGIFWMSWVTSTTQLRYCASTVPTTNIARMPAPARHRT